MIVLYILAGLAALVILVLLMRLRITVSYSKAKESAGSPTVHLGIGPVKLKLYPKKEKKLQLSDYSAKKYKKLLESDAAPKHMHAKKKTKEKKYGKNELLPGGIGETFELVSELVEKFTGHLRCEVLRLRIMVGTNDAASTALTCGVVSSAVSLLLELIANYTDMRLKQPQDIFVEPDFDSGEIHGEVRIKFSIRVINILRAGKGFIINYIRTMIRLDNQNKK